RTRAYCFQLIRSTVPLRLFHLLKYFQHSTVHIRRQRTAERAQRSWANVSKIRWLCEGRFALDTTTPGDKDAVTRVCASSRVRRNDHITVTRPLVVNVFIPTRNHYQIRKTSRKNSAESLFTSQDLLKHWSSVRRISDP